MKNVMNELGRIGQKRYGGIFYEEFLPELRGKRGIKTFYEMSENDDTVSGFLFAIKMLIRQAAWNVMPSGETNIDRECAEFTESCMHDMSDTWSETLSEILSFLVYGWSAHEIVYKRRCGKNKDKRLRSKFNDGLIGWRKLPIRAQESLYEWLFENDSDDLSGLVQMPPPDFGLIEIPINRLLLFRTESRNGSPEGRSILRGAYRSWYFKKRIQEIEGIGIERDLAGLPVLTAPEGVDIWGEEGDMTRLRMQAEELIQNIRRDSTEGVVKPEGWQLDLLSTGGARQFDTSAIISRYDTQIALTVMADFLLLGHQQVGSFALSDNKTELFAVAIGGFMDAICEVFNDKAIPDLIDMNAEHFNGITDYPRLTHGDIEDADLEKLGTFIEKMTGSGLITPDENIEDHVREVAGLPERVGEWQGAEPGTEADRQTAAARKVAEEDAEAVMKARRELGRFD